MLRAVLAATPGEAVDATPHLDDVLDVPVGAFLYKILSHALGSRSEAADETVAMAMRGLRP